MGSGVTSVPVTAALSRVRQAAARLLLALALCAAIIRGGIPPGYMFAEAETPSGRYMVMSICEGHETRARIIDLATGEEVETPTGDESATGATDTCVFSWLSQLSTPPETVSLGPVAPVSRTSQPLPGCPVPGRGLAAPPPPATGPPQTL
jgi:hypothetical protein